MDIISFLFDLTQDPISYSIIFFIYVVLAAVILPIPVEIGLFNPNINPVLLISILALGKGFGAFIVFEIGLKIRKGIKKRFHSGALTKKFIDYCEIFVKKYGYVGLFIIMSIPLMIDSASLYFFSLLNSEGENNKRSLAKSRFIIINIAAGALRGSIILFIAHFIGLRLV